MRTNILTLASELSDHDLLARIGVLAASEREATVELVAHLAALDSRPSLYAAQGHGSLFRYCTDALRLSEDATVRTAPAESAVLTSPPLPSTRRPVIEATSPDRYRVQFTFGKESHDRLRRLQILLRREIPDGDPGAIVDRALTLLLEKVEKQKLGAASRRATPAMPKSARSIRPGADKRSDRPSVASRHIPAAVQGGVCQRDGDQCAFVSKDGRRCTERTFLEFHHIRPYALGGEATVENISLRCRRHNQYEAELVFGPHGASVVRETPIGQWAGA